MYHARVLAASHSIDGHVVTEGALLYTDCPKNPLSLLLQGQPMPGGPPRPPAGATRSGPPCAAQTGRAADRNFKSISAGTSGARPPEHLTTQSSRRALCAQHRLRLFHWARRTARTLPEYVAGVHQCGRLDAYRDGSRVQHPTTASEGRCRACCRCRRKMPLIFPIRPRGPSLDLLSGS
jgi:hypothetical protein